MIPNTLRDRAWSILYPQYQDLQRYFGEQLPEARSSIDLYDTPAFLIRGYLEVIVNDDKSVVCSFSGQETENGALAVNADIAVGDRIIRDVYWESRCDGPNRDEQFLEHARVFAQACEESRTLILDELAKRPDSAP